MKAFINNHFYNCVDEGLLAQGGGQVSDLHIIHVGILGDPNHSPKSLHSESRAIDIHSLKLRLTNGEIKTIKYKGLSNRPFFTAFRKCWGKTVQKYNSCPLYNGSHLKTGSIGWEDSHHQNHLHVSVPYCFNGQYGPYYYRR